MARGAAILLILLWAPWATASGLHADASAEARSAAHCSSGSGHAPEAPPLTSGEQDDACLLHCTTAAQAAPATAATTVFPPVACGLAAVLEVAPCPRAARRATARRPEPQPPDPLSQVVLRL